MRNVALIILAIYFSALAKGQGKNISLNETSATVWLSKQTISGKINGFYTSALKVSCNGKTSAIAVKKDSTFSFAVDLKKGDNKISVSTVEAAVTSDTINFSLGYNPEPVIKPSAIARGERLTLHWQMLENPWKEPVKFTWSDDQNNPFPSKIQNKNSDAATLQLPSANGIYYFNLTATTAHDTATFQTYVIRNASKIEVFNMDKNYASWIDDAVIYEITPSAFVKDGSYDDISNKLEELKQLGINTIWLQPVFSTFYKGQGYDIIDYFALREDFGTARQLRDFIAKAKKMQIKVLFDFVPNHTSVHHPYAQDCIRNGKKSHYYNFYQHEDDGAAYSSLYKKDKNGFINYFWEDLVNLNYNSEEVQQWMLEACKYWVKKFDIDGYRFDAVWAVNARTPAFSQKLKTVLKSIKPNLFLLAEDKGAVANVYKAGFDAAYDWAADTAWISRWSWQYTYTPALNQTIFNYPDAGKRPAMLMHAIFHNGDPANLRLRFLENNDLPRFIKNHSAACTEMAAALLFSLPGILMLYNGQEIGFSGHPYSKHFIYDAGRSIQSSDSNHLFGFYQNLIQLRKNYPALSSKNIDSLPVFPSTKMVAFRRWKNNQHFIIVLNMDSLPSEATLSIQNILGTFLQNRINGLTDILTNTTFKIDNPAEIKIPMQGYSIRWLLVK